MTSELAPAADFRDPRGSIWRRWEPHIHTPGTALADEYGSMSMDDYLTEIEQVTPAIEVLGVTDYYVTRRYEEVLAERENGRLPGVKTLFCNIELRLSIETKAGKGVNLHLLVSPENADHVDQLKRFLSKLTFHYAKDDFACTEDDLKRLGRAHDELVQEDESALLAGVNQFKVDFQQLRRLYEDTEWAQRHLLIAVAGSSNDGTAGLQDAAASFAATRKEIEAFAHIIFTATPKNIEFWKGEGVLDAKKLAAKYGGPKPCLHGSDAHRAETIGKPDGERLCWIKGDPTFDALRHACMEPTTRAHIGPTPPATETPYAVTSVATPTLQWLLPAALPVNTGMVAIIGARGSGKTALADLIAHAGHSPLPTTTQESFLSRAGPFLAGADVEATFSEGPPSRLPLTGTVDDSPEVNYLTQQFVDKLCSSVGQSDELLEEIQRVVFVAHEPGTRLGTDNFDALVAARSGETRLAVEALNQQLDRLSEDLHVERDWFYRRGAIEQQLKQTLEEIRKTDVARQNLAKPGGTDRAAYYARLNEAVSAREADLQRESRLLQALKNLAVEVVRYKQEQFPQILQDLRTVHGEAKLTADEWAEFKPRFAGDPEEIVAARVKTQGEQVTATRQRDGTSPTVSMSAEQLAKCRHDALKQEQSKVAAEIGTDKKNVQRLGQLTTLRSTLDAKRRRLEEEAERANGSSEQMKRIVEQRAQLYGRFFDLVVQQCEIMSDLYEPLQKRLGAQKGAVEKLALRVVRDVNVDAWAQAGEDLLDLRKNGRFRGRGALAEVACDRLLPAWRDGSADDVAVAMKAFREEFDASLLEQSRVDRAAKDEFEQWIIELGRWIYSTDHISVQYSIEYEGVPITQLSPGTRGIVLLLLYLALDEEDSRPLVIDQPEENLDPESVFAELVGLFKEARNRRQVIIVTHNANLVVNTDVDQVIVASCVKAGGGSPPQFHYLSGGLEDAEIRRHVCNILEGGRDAFLQRARRLRVSLG